MLEYVVQPGDTLYSIAQRFGVTVQAILAVNPSITDPNLIFVGQVIIIPVPTPTPVPCPILRRGDRGPQVRRLQIALNTNGFSPGPIDGIFGPATERAVRNLQAARGLAVTGVVNVATWQALGFNCGVVPTPPPRPTPTPTPTPGFDYIVQAGDTLFLIAARFGVTLQALLAANPQITDPNVIVPGQRIRVPSA